MPLQVVGNVLPGKRLNLPRLGIDPCGIRRHRPRRPARTLQDADIVVPAAGRGRPPRTRGPPHHFGRIRSLGKTKLHCALLRPARSYFQRLIPPLPIAIAVSAIKMRMPVRTSAAGSSASDITACEIKSKGGEWM